MNVVMLRVVGGTSASASPLSPNPEDVRREATRRLGLLGYGQHKARALATGTPISHRIRHLALQIGFVSDTLSALTEIPEDFRSDVYWPSLVAAID